MQPDYLVLTVIAVLDFLALFIFVRFGWNAVLAFGRRQEERYDRVFNQQLLLNVHPRLALLATVMVIVLTGAVAMFIGGSSFWFIPGALLACFVPWLILRHLEQKRHERLEQQLVDGIMTLASGVRAGLNLVQAMELLVTNQTGPIKQEFAQMLREYQMGLDLNQAMRNTSNRIGSSHYRLLFTAIEMHRTRGGDTAQSLDRIAESVREIQRLEGKLDALTAQGRSQANMLALAPVVILFLLYLIDPVGVRDLFVLPMGRLFLLGAAILIFTGFYWIRQIMNVDI